MPQNNRKFNRRRQLFRTIVAVDNFFENSIVVDHPQQVKDLKKADELKQRSLIELYAGELKVTRPRKIRTTPIHFVGKKTPWTIKRQAFRESHSVEEIVRRNKTVYPDGKIEYNVSQIERDCIQYGHRNRLPFVPPQQESVYEWYKKWTNPNLVIKYRNVIENIGDAFHPFLTEMVQPRTGSYAKSVITTPDEDPIKLTMEHRRNWETIASGIAIGTLYRYRSLRKLLDESADKEMGSVELFNNFQKEIKSLIEHYFRIDLTKNSRWLPMAMHVLDVECSRIDFVKFERLPNFLDTVEVPKKIITVKKHGIIITVKKFFGYGK